MYVRTDKGKTIWPSPLLGGDIKTPVEPRMIKQQAKLSTAWGLYRGVNQFCCNDYRQMSRVSSMLKELGWEAFQSRRDQNKATMMYSILNNIVEIPTGPYLIATGVATRGHQ